MERTLEQRIEELEKKVAELEGRAPEQPKTLNFDVKVSIDKNIDIDAIAEKLESKIVDELRKITNYLDLLEQRRAEREKKVIFSKDHQVSNQ